MGYFNYLIGCRWLLGELVEGWHLDVINWLDRSHELHLKHLLQPSH